MWIYLNKGETITSSIVLERPLALTCPLRFSTCHGATSITHDVKITKYW